MIFPEVISEEENRDFDFLDEASDSEINNIYPKIFLVVHNGLN